MRPQANTRIRTNESCLDYVDAYQRAVALRRAEEAAAMAELTLEAAERVRASFRKFMHAAGKALLRTQPTV